jgi:DNA-binding NtrC family response regulator
MKTKILIIDKDQETINSLTWFFTSLRLEPVAMHKWPTSIKTLKLEELAAVFVDVELMSVKLENLYEVFSDKAEQNSAVSALLFFMYSRTFAPRFQEAQKHRHTGSFKKPVRLDDVYSQLTAHMAIEKNPCRGHDYLDKLRQFTKFSADYKVWLKQLGKLIQAG